jgi:hypothetical protein
MSLVFNTHSQSSWHGLGQLLHQVVGQLHPHVLDGVLELLQQSDGKILIQLFFHNGPQVLDGVEVQGISPQPVNDGNSLLSQKSHNFLAGVTGQPILKEMGGAMDLHDEEEFFVQHRHVLVAVHRHLGWLEEIQSSVTVAAVAGPYHNIHVVFDVYHCELLLVSA